MHIWKSKSIWSHIFPCKQKQSISKDKKQYDFDKKGNISRTSWHPSAYLHNNHMLHKSLHANIKHISSLSMRWHINTMTINQYAYTGKANLFSFFLFFFFLNRYTEKQIIQNTNETQTSITHTLHIHNHKPN